MTVAKAAFVIWIAAFAGNHAVSRFLEEGDFVTQPLLDRKIVALHGKDTGFLTASTPPRIFEPMLITGQIRDLVAEAEQADGTRLDTVLGLLVKTLHESCQTEENRKRYACPESQQEPSPYPLEAGGYAKSFDVLSDEEGFFETWRKHGMVVGRGVAPLELCTKTVKRINQVVNSLTNGKCNLEQSETWESLPADSAGTSLVSRGFFELYHDAVLGEIRQLVRLYLHHAVIWGRAELWTSFDRLGVKLPGHEDSRALPLHVDQNPNVCMDFRTVQGVLALVDCPVERGTFVGAPGSRQYFEVYRAMAQNRGEFVELNLSDPAAKILQELAQPFPLRAGDLVSWDSRSTHCNTENISNLPRYVAYVAQGPARSERQDLLKARLEAWESGIGSNHREALMHASKKSRYTNPAELAGVRQPEKLNLLGKLLYGHET